MAMLVKAGKRDLQNLMSLMFNDPLRQLKEAKKKKSYAISVSAL